MLRRVVKIAFIGAGSVEFTRDLLADLLSFEELADVHVALHDIDPERLETGEAMARWTNERLGGRAQISTHASRREALDGADFAVNMIQVGGHAATLLDFEIPARHGLRQTIADTLGIGGIFRALRTIPVMLDIGADMAELCPDAWLLNYTNPMAMLCQAYGHGSPHTKIVGLCHSVQHTTRRLAGLVGVPFEDVTFVGAGVNHQSFILRFEHAGEDLYPRLDAVIASDEDLQRTVRVEMYRRLGYFPTESSEHSAEYLPWLMHDDAARERFRIPVDDYVRRSEDNLVEYAEMRAALRDGRGFEIHSEGLEYAPGIVHSIVTRTERVIYGNVLNHGLIDNLPNGACVEVPCLVDGAGLQPTRIGALPPQCAALNRTFLNVVELTVRAALEGRRDHVYHAAMLDPNAAASLDLDTIRTVCDELIEAHGDALPAGVRA
jgi:alpha-galactosidase